MWQEPPAASIFSLAVAVKPWARTSSFLEISPRARILTGSERFARPFSLSVSRLTSAPGVEAVLEVGEVDRLGLGAGVLERHRLLFVRAAQLSHPHVDRVLPALVAGLPLRAGARPVPLVPRPEVLPSGSPRRGRSRLRGVREPGFGLDVVQPDLLRALAGGRLLLLGGFRPLFGFSAIVDLDQVGDDPDLPLQLRASPCARPLCRSGPARAPSGCLSALGLDAVGGANLPDRERAHDREVSSAGSSSARSLLGGRGLGLALGGATLLLASPPCSSLGQRPLPRPESPPRPAPWPPARSGAARPPALSCSRLGGGCRGWGPRRLIARRGRGVSSRDRSRGRDVSTLGDSPLPSSRRRAPG